MDQVLFQVAMQCSKSQFCKKYSPAFYHTLYRKASAYLHRIKPHFPPIGPSFFAPTYRFGPMLMSVCKALEDMGASQDQINEILWALNENMLRRIPKAAAKCCGTAMVKFYRKKTPLHEQRNERGKLSPIDWKIHFHVIDDSAYEIEIVECAFLKLAKELGAEKMLPGICRIDYMMAHYLGYGFYRTKTLADGDLCCNCRYSLRDTCEWAPDKGFFDRQ